MKIIKLFILTALLSTVFPLAAEESVIRIEKGDTLYSISREYKVPVSLLLSYNNISNPEKLFVGMEIKVPGAYTVQKGDTLYGIARMAGISLSELCEINGISSEYPLKPGEMLVLPFKDISADEEEGIEAADAEGKTDDLFSGEETEFFWPHSGERIVLDGKLKGQEILGEKGDKIVSVSSGKVVWVAPYRGYGRLIMVETKDHHIYAYGGNEETFVKVGDSVEPGTALGIMGINPIEKNAKAFFFVYKDGKPVDPSKAPRT